MPAEQTERPGRVRRVGRFLLRLGLATLILWSGAILFVTLSVDLPMAPPGTPALGEWIGPVHVHTTASHDGGGSMDDVATAAAAQGLDFVLIGDHNFHPPRADGGVVYLFDSKTGDVLRTFHNPAPAIDDNFGCAVAVVGGNVLVGANQANANGLNVGAVYLFDGSTGMLLHTFQNPTPTWWDIFGAIVTGLGNNIVIVAPFDDTTGPNAGAVYLFEGGSSAEFAASGPRVRCSCVFPIAGRDACMLYSANQPM